LSDEIPGAALQHEPQRLDLSRHDTGRALVADLHASLIPHRIGDRGQKPRVIGAAEPADGVEMKSRCEPVGGVLRALRQRSGQFQLRRRQQIGEPKFSRRSRQSGEKECRGFGRRQTGELGAIPVEELEPAIGTPIGIDRYICRAQLVDVAIDRANRDLELVS
jgi:hypothetical protein